MRLFVLLPLLFFAAGPNAGAQPIELVHPPEHGCQYETLVFRFSENLNFENPFDLETNRVELMIQQPDNSTTRVSFFYDGPGPDGKDQWEARFAPKQSGVHEFEVRLSGKVRAELEVPVRTNDKKNQGGLRISNRLGVFEYESGEAFRGIGLNVCWANDYEYYFRKMKAAGINITRIWMCPWNLSFEWQETGLGRYSLETARRLDGILRLAEQYGIYVILCFDYHGVAPKGLGFFREDRWQVNPYNKANGGPCGERVDFFTNVEAKTYSKRKYKYLISRYGHSRNLATWEFFNEADLMAGKAIPINQWHIEMAEYVKSIDIHGRLVSTSGTRRYVEKVVDAFRSPAMDYVMYHDYNSLDLAPHYTYLTEAGLEYYQKPYVLGEFGVEYRGGDLTFKIDPEHVGLHNGIWAGWFNETPIIPLTWWWDNYIDPHNLWAKFANLSRFAGNMDFSGDSLAFKTLTSGHLSEDPGQQVSCMVRAIYTRAGVALWLKNDEYKWSLVSEGKKPRQITSFIQSVPYLAPGGYSIRWYDPQKGDFMETDGEARAGQDGILTLKVPGFSRDIACLITRKP